MKKGFMNAVLTAAVICLAVCLCLVSMGFTRPGLVLAEEGEMEATMSSEDAEAPDADAPVSSEDDADAPKEGDDAPGDGVLTTGAEDTLTTGENSAETTGADDAETTGEEKEGIRFVLFEKLKKLETKDWIFLAGAAAIAVALIVFLATRRKTPDTGVGQKVSPTIVLIHGALCIALSFVLSYVKLFSMPTGGSVTLASMLPLMVYANRYGVRNGMLAGLVYGILQYVQGGWFVHWLQFIFDYPLAFALIGLGGIVRGERNLVPSVLIGGIARFLSHFIGGAIFFGKYVMLGEGAETGMTFAQMIGPNLWASLVYNAPYMLADIAICVVIALLPPFRKAIRTALKY